MLCSVAEYAADAGLKDDMVGYIAADFEGTQELVRILVEAFLRAHHHLSLRSLSFPPSPAISLILLLLAE